MSDSFQEFSVQSLRIEGFLSKSNGIYAIPAYQRAYSWGETQIGTLIRDLVDYSSLKHTEPYSLGTIVCDVYQSKFNDDSQNIYLILDGQQRITTIDLLLSVINEKLEKENSEQIISAYCYLDGTEPNKKTALPPHDTQKELIRSILSFLTKERLRDIKENILNNISISRIVIPLCGEKEIQNEAATMFEIINLRGQKLSNLDIVKSRLLTLIPEEEQDVRKIFNQLWSSFEIKLNNKCKKGFDLKKARKLRNQKSSGIGIGLNFNEIISSNNITYYESEDEIDEPIKANIIPPIDMTNLLVMALILLQAKKYNWNPEAFESRALNEKGLLTSIDNFMQDAKLNKNAPLERFDSSLWSLMGIMNILLQIVTNWTPYRTKTNSVDNFYYQDDSLARFNQLQLSFMAANSYQYSSQYWLLILAMSVIRKTIIPTNVDELLNMQIPKLSDLKENAFLNLISWGFNRCLIHMSNATKEALNNYSENPRYYITTLQSQIPNACLEWTYDGNLTMWHLYFIDYLIWLDWSNQRDGKLSQMIKTMEFFSSKYHNLKNLFKDFDKLNFIGNVGSSRIVARGAVEHWLAQDYANDDIRKLKKLHGLGNLALIDASLNSTLRDNSPNQKQEKVLSATNPSLKLRWLASLNNTAIDDDSIEPLTKMWGYYMSNFHIS